MKYSRETVNHPLKNASVPDSSSRSTGGGLGLVLLSRGDDDAELDALLGDGDGFDSVP